MSHSELPPGDVSTEPSLVTDSILSGNLDAIHKLDRLLHRRLCQPVDGTHIVMEHPKGPMFQHHQPRYPYKLGKKAVQRSLPDLTGEQRVFLFGVGLGEQLRFRMD